MYPEETFEAAVACQAAGLKTLEHDCWLLTDNSLGLMHDSTVDRVTTSTGNVQALDSPGFKALQIDANSWHGTNFGNALVPPLYSELLALYAKRMLFFSEAKSTGNTGQKMVDALVAAGVPVDMAHINSFSLSQLTPAKTAGYTVSFNANTGDSTEIAAAQAAGVTIVGLNAQNHNDTIVGNWIAAGFSVIMAGANRRSDRDHYVSLGVRTFYADDPAYLIATGPMATQDNFASGRWMNGMLSPATADSYIFTDNSRGSFQSPKYWGFQNTNTESVLMGWACPIKGNNAANNFTIAFNFTFDSVLSTDDTRWGAVMIADAAKTDKAFDPNTGSSQNGYHFLFRRNGSIQIFRYDNGTATLLQTTTGSTLTFGTAYAYQIVVTPTSLTLNALNGDGSVNRTVTSADTTYRGGYFHLGHSGCTCRYDTVVIS
jgi:glycerophosphoryl diester phosphodiesterase